MLWILTLGSLQVLFTSSIMFTFSFMKRHFYFVMNSSFLHAQKLEYTVHKKNEFTPYKNGHNFTQCAPQLFTAECHCILTAWCFMLPLRKGAAIAVNNYDAATVVVFLDVSCQLFVRGQPLLGRSKHPKWHHVTANIRSSVPLI